MTEENTESYIHKKWVFYYMLKGCLLFNLLAIGGYHAYFYANQWLGSQGVEYDLMALDLPDLYKLADQIDEEIDFRTKPVKPKK